MRTKEDTFKKEMLLSVDGTCAYTNKKIFIYVYITPEFVGPLAAPKHNIFSLGTLTVVNRMCLFLFCSVFYYVL